MVDIGMSPRVEVHNPNDILSFRDKIFYPASEWRYLMRRNMQEIVPGLYLGPYSSALKQCRTHLLEQGITHIVCVREPSVEGNFIYPQLDETFTYLTLDIADSTFECILKFIPKVNSFINNALKRKGKVLVHGNTGISRSAALVIAYIMENFNLSNMDALKVVKEKRGCIKPNDGFANQLHEYQFIYRTQMFFATRGECSKTNNITWKRKHVELEEPGPVMKGSDGQSSFKKISTGVGKVSFRCKS